MSIDSIAKEIVLLKRTIFSRFKTFYLNENILDLSLNIVAYCSQNSSQDIDLQVALNALILS
jgi:hypothetical protein